MPVPDPVRNIKLTIAYDGTDFVGWQRQAEGTSIQGLIEDALAPMEGGPVTVNGAGRTDAGVHALAQVASVRLKGPHDVGTIARALNAVLPAAIRIVRAEEAAPDFHARFSATGKVYEYRLVNASFVSPFLDRYAWHVPQRLDADAMKTAARALEGRHDFAAFQGTGSEVPDTMRTIESIEWRGSGGWDAPIVMRVTGDGFLRHMVRNIAGTLVEIGAGRWDASQMRDILESRDRGRAGTTAPARGLFLVEVRY